MLKKLLYIGLGISIIVVKKSVSYLIEKKEQAGEQFAADMPADEVVSPDAPTPESIAQAVADEVEPVVRESETEAKADDLTEINGIGPTYAERLKEAGITTFAALAKKSPEELRTVTKAAGKSADAESWINQAAGLA